MKKFTTRGFYGIGIYHTKTKENVGTMWRSAHNFGANFIFTIGRRYQHQSTDTTKAWRTVPLYEYLDFTDFYNHLPKDCRLIGIEQTDTSRDISDFIHPPRCVYILGAEDHGLPDEILARCYDVVHINTPMCLNVSVAGSIVMFDRRIKLNQKER